MLSFMDVFSRVKEYCEKNTSDINYNLWIQPLEPLKYEDNKAYLFTKNSFMKDVVAKNYTPVLEEGFKVIMGFDVEVVIVCEEDEDVLPAVEPAPLPKINQDPLKNEELKRSYAGAEYDYTFDTFIVGSSNNFAYAACRAVTKAENKDYNPLFIYGPSGLGKTHLLHAIEYEIKRNYPQKKIVYTNGETFMNEFYVSIENSSMDKFRDKYRSADVLLVDDIQFLSGKDRMQEEFFHTFEALHQEQKQIVLASDRPPKDIKTLEDRLRNRFESGLITDITYPDFETRIAIIRRKAQLLNIAIPDDVAQFIANKLKKNIRQLEGAVKKLKALKLLAGTSPSVSMAQNVINDILNDNEPLPVTVDRILNEVSRTYDVTVEEICSKKSSSRISAARQVSMYVMKQVTSMRLEEIGNKIGGRNHSTVIYSISQAEKMMKNDVETREKVEDIIKNIKDN
ncbi:MAG: chromosomal replication initiator protein DnaA [Oscillospiraceae bacterium]